MRTLILQIMFFLGSIYLAIFLWILYGLGFASFGRFGCILVLYCIYGALCSGVSFVLGHTFLQTWYEIFKSGRNSVAVKIFRKEWKGEERMDKFQIYLKS